MIQVKDTSQVQEVIPYNKWTFPTGETGVKFPEPIVKGKMYNVYWNYQSDAELIEVLLVCNALQEQGANVMLIVPYLPHSRQDRVCHAGEAFALKVLLQTLRTLNVVVCTYDVHSSAAYSFHHQLYNVPQGTCQEKLPKFDFLIAPDKGAADKAKGHKQAKEGVPVVFLSKTRIDGKVVYEDFTSTELSGKVCVVDDLCDGGATFVALGEMLRRLHPDITELNLSVTHGCFTQGLDKIKKIYDNVYCTFLHNSKGLVQENEVILLK